jgi:hypothetical protein
VGSIDTAEGLRKENEWYLTFSKRRWTGSGRLGSLGERKIKISLLNNGLCGAVEKVPSVVFARSYSDEAI